MIALLHPPPRTEPRPSGSGRPFAAALFFTAQAAAQQSALDPAGPQAARIASLWWSFNIVLTVIFVIVIGVMLWALSRRRPDGETLESLHTPSAETEQRLTRTVAIGVFATVVILFGLLIASVGTGKAISNLANKKNGMTIEVTGNQWWWHVRYLDDDASQTVITANEIHIPVGRPVQIRGTSNDVIHSFWVPNLHGKRDLIPSRVTDEWIQADRPGRYRGQCAEFCGMQHAHMALWVVAESPADFEAWKRRQLEPAIPPSNATTRVGLLVFEKYACIYCHTIRGTLANGQVGPDLTHFASRSTIAAGTLPNTKGNLAGWIVDPQSIKPGNRMATLHIEPHELQPLIEYLESLQ
jgi:cytochrome c oxidase subunit II